MMIRATLVYAFIALYVLILGPVALIWVLLTKETRHLYALARFCVRASGILAGIRVRIEGRDKISEDGTYLFLSNHQGNSDAPVLLHSIPRNWREVVKHEMMRLPVLSIIMRYAEFVPVERRNPQQARSAINYGASLLSRGYSFITFPEGTRSRDGHLGVFKKGAFIMAIKAQVPVVPITIDGSGDVQPPGRYIVKPGIIKVFFHDPIPTRGMEIEDRNRLMEMTRNAIASKLTV